MNNQNQQTDISKSGEKDKEKFQVHLDKPYIRENYTGTGKLRNKVAIITGGDSGIGRAVALHYAREGAEIAIVYLKSDEDAADTKKMVENEGSACLLFRGDISIESFCRKVVNETYDHFKRLDILVNNAGTHEDAPEVKDISQEQLVRTFAVNTFSFFYFTKAALEVMKAGSVIINTASVVAYRGSGHLLDYSASKGAIVTFTRSLAENLAEKKIRVNGIAPGPIWTPLVIYSFDADHLEKFGKDTTMGRAGYPQEVAPAYVWLASEESSYMTGQMIHINGGDIING
ncbi:MAG: glucose 1-dehydrogenase [Bacteroidota bacterium]|nr:glucose 1-dehydrogenase [Bacteroidota bacterium]